MTFYIGKATASGTSAGNAASWAKRLRKGKVKPTKTMNRKQVARNSRRQAGME